MLVIKSIPWPNLSVVKPLKCHQTYHEQLAARSDWSDIGKQPRAGGGVSLRARQRFLVNASVKLFVYSRYCLRHLIIVTKIMRTRVGMPIDVTLRLKLRNPVSRGAKVLLVNSETVLYRITIDI